MNDVLKNILLRYLSYFEEAVESREPAPSKTKEYLRMADLHDKMILDFVDAKVELGERNAIYVIRNMGEEIENLHERNKHYIKILRALYAN